MQFCRRIKMAAGGKSLITEFMFPGIMQYAHPTHVYQPSQRISKWQMPIANVCEASFLFRVPVGYHLYRTQFLLHFQVWLITSPEQKWFPVRHRTCRHNLIWENLFNSFSDALPYRCSTSWFKLIRPLYASGLALEMALCWCWMDGKHWWSP